MGKLTCFLLGVSISVCGCAAATFSYKYYAIDAVDYSGYLRGPTAKDDLSFAVCKPTPGKAAPCIAMLKDPYLQLKADDMQCHSDLDACQRGR